MMRKVRLALAICAMAAIILLVFHGWRQGGLALLPINMPFC